MAVPPWPSAGRSAGCRSWAAGLPRWRRRPYRCMHARIHACVHKVVFGCELCQQADKADAALAIAPPDANRLKEPMLLLLSPPADANVLLMDETSLANTFTCQPQQRNMHGRVFGGFLMRWAQRCARILDARVRSCLVGQPRCSCHMHQAAGMCCLQMEGVLP